MTFPNGLGLAYHSGHLALGAFGGALVSVGGLMRPPMAGAALLLASHYSKSVWQTLFVLGTLLLLSTLIWVRSLHGWLMLPALGLVILYLSLESVAWVQVFSV